MSKYTTSLKEIVEQYTFGDPTDIYTRIDIALTFIFDFDFPLFDETHRQDLERKIVLHYFNKEIGFETLGLWKLYLRERLNLIMPYYNNLYEIESNKFDYLVNLGTTQESEEDGKKEQTEKITENGTDTNSRNLQNEKTRSENYTNNENVETSGTSHTQDSNKNQSDHTMQVIGNNLESDLPQATYGNKDYATQMAQTDSTTTENTGGSNSGNSDTTLSQKETKSGNNIGTIIENDKGTITDNGTKNNTRDENGTVTEQTKGVTKLSGFNVSQTQLMMEYRNSLINIDKMIINELRDLFMCIY